MKRIILLFFITLLISTINAQNLVPNPSFEEHTACPDYENELNLATGWKSYYATPDYFNICATNINFSVPYNLYGSYQPSSNGVAYAGFFAYWSPIYGNGKKNLREHIGRQLASPLIIGKKYYVSFKVSLADNSLSMGSANCATNNLGIKFSTIPYDNFADSSGSSPLVNNFAHIYETTLISDTINWTTISGSFVADSAYNYLIIANFFNDANTDTLLFHPSQLYCFAYYYVDDICVSTDSISCGSTEIDENDFRNSIKIFPNPFNISTSIIIPNQDLKLSGVSVSDLLGRSQNFNSSIISDNNNITIIIDRGNLTAGIYLLKIKLSNKIFTQELLITN